MTTPSFNTRRRFLELSQEEVDALFDAAYDRLSLVLKVVAFAVGALLAASYLYWKAPATWDTFTAISDALITALGVGLIAYFVVLFSCLRCIGKYASTMAFRAFAAKREAQ